MRQDVLVDPVNLGLILVKLNLNAIFLDQQAGGWKLGLHLLLELV